MVFAPVLPEARMPLETNVAAAVELPLIFRIVFPVAERLGKTLWIPYTAYAPTRVSVMAPPPPGPPIVLLLTVVETPVLVLTRIPLNPVVVPVPPELIVIAPMLLLEMVLDWRLKSRMPRTGVVLAVVDPALMTIVAKPSRLPMVLPVTFARASPAVPTEMAANPDEVVLVELAPVV